MTINPMHVVIAVLTLILVLFLFKHKSPLIEGLNNPAHTEFVAKGLKNDIVSLQDSLHISKYQDNYHEIVKDMAEWCDLAILKTIVSNKINISDGVNTENTKLITSLNQYSQFRETLSNISDTVLTNIPSSK
jgi:hypothetical protein